MKQKFYKIRNKSTGKFSRGGSSPLYIWTKKGKTWSDLGHVKNHLAQFLNRYENYKDNYPYKNAELIEIEVDYENCTSYDIEEIMKEVESNSQKRINQHREASLKLNED